MASSSEHDEISDSDSDGGVPLFSKPQREAIAREDSAEISHSDSTQHLVADRLGAKQQSCPGDLARGVEAVRHGDDYEISCSRKRKFSCIAQRKSKGTISGAAIKTMATQEPSTQATTPEVETLLKNLTIGESTVTMATQSAQSPPVALKAEAKKQKQKQKHKQKQDYSPPDGPIIILSGKPAQELRDWVATQPEFDPKSFVMTEELTQGSCTLAHVQEEYLNRLQALGREKTIESLARAEFGPTEMPLFTFLVQETERWPLDRPDRRALWVSYVRFYALQAEIPVDGYDITGTTAFSVALSCIPDIVEILLEAGAKINHQNRYGRTAAHDLFANLHDDLSPTYKKFAVNAIKYFMEHGGDVDIKDGEGISAREMGLKMKGAVPLLGVLLAGEKMPVGGSFDDWTKIKRNEKCGCGSGKKSKNCCGPLN